MNPNLEQMEAKIETLGANLIMLAGNLAQLAGAVQEHNTILKQLSVKIQVLEAHNKLQSIIKNW